MLDFLNKIIPNVMHSTDRLLDSILATLQMTLWSGVVMFVCGLFLGVVLTVTREGGIMQRKALYQVLDKLINVCRSIPFVIFIAILLPVTKAIMGTKIGVRGVIVPLVAASVPFFARQVESALAHVEHGLIEAAESMGKSPVNIIFTVYLYESIPAIARGTTITLINLIGLTAMAGYEAPAASATMRLPGATITGITTSSGFPCCSSSSSCRSFSLPAISSQNGFPIKPIQKGLYFQ